MKRIATIMMLIAAIMVGATSVDAKTTKRSTKAKTSQTAKKSSSGVILKIKEIGGDISLMKDGKIRYNNKNINGEFTENNGAYFVISGSGEDIETSFIYGNSSYLLVSNEFITGIYDNAKAYDFYGYVRVHGLKKSVSFNPSNKTITVNTDRGSRTISLSELQNSVTPRSVVWY